MSQLKRSVVMTLILVVAAATSLLTYAATSGASVWRIVPGTSVGPVRLGIGPTQASQILGQPKTACIVTVTNKRPLPGERNIIPRYVTTDYYYPQLGLHLHFLGARGLTGATVSLDEFLPLKNHTDPMGAIIEYSCRGPRPVRLQARTVRYKASGIGLGDPMERVLEVLGEPEYAAGEDPSIPARATFAYLRRGISFYGQAGIIVAIQIQLRP